MKIAVDASSLRESSWHGHLLRFVVGGAVTVGTGLVAKELGPVVGGVFLAFPAIFPLSAAMIEKLANKKVGPSARGDRARRAVVSDAAGAAMGSVGMIAFAVTAWYGLRARGAAIALLASAAAWAVVACATWVIRRRWVNRAP